MYTKASRQPDVTGKLSETSPGVIYCSASHIIVCSAPLALWCASHLLRCREEQRSPPMQKWFLMIIYIDHKSLALKLSSGKKGGQDWSVRRWKRGPHLGGRGNMRQEFGVNSVKLEDFLTQDQDLWVFSSSKAHYLSAKPAVIETVLRKCLASSSWNI